MFNIYPSLSSFCGYVKLLNLTWWRTTHGYRLNGLSRTNPGDGTMGFLWGQVVHQNNWGELTHLLSGMNHQVCIFHTV